jgi:hypothetical protein
VSEHCDVREQVLVRNLGIPHFPQLDFCRPSGRFHLIYNNVGSVDQTGRPLNFSFWPALRNSPD